MEVEYIHGTGHYRSWKGNGQATESKTHPEGSEEALSLVEEGWGPGE